MTDPVLHYLFQFARDESQRGQWGRTVDYFVWTDLRPRDEAPLTLWELVPEGALRIPDTDATMHIVRGGRPHHVEHLFGYWRVCDADIVSVRNVQPEGVYHALILGGCPGAYNNDAILWICPKCAQQLARFDLATGPKGWDRFWQEEQRRVQDFNADAKLRTCKGCGFVHPLAFRFDPAQDTDAERAARRAW